MNSINNNEKKERRRIIIDFEVLSKVGFWMVCMKDYKTKTEHTIINDRKEFIRIFNKNKDAVWVGYNIKGYDQWIMKAIIAGIDPCIVSDKLIQEKLSGWKIDRALNKIKLLLFELSSGMRSLKELELFMGEDIRETTVPFDLMTYPTQSQIDELKIYCLHDVRMTYKVFEETYYEYESQLGLIKYFDFSPEMLNKTKAQLSATILGAKKNNFDRNDDFEFEIVDTLKLDKYKNIKEWYLNMENRKYNTSCRCIIYGLETDFGWGGLHCARKKYQAEGFIVNSDVSSFYPSLMIEYNMLSRNVTNPHKFKEIKQTRIKFKEEKNPIEKSLKIVLNSTYGSSKDINNDLYDPMMGNAVCVNGQLLLLDLIEKVELGFKDSAEFIQGNTDGVMFKFNCKEDVKRYIEICKEWSIRTRMDLEHDFIEKIIQKDVNNYIFIQDNGKIKSKGAYVKKLSLIDNDLPIINKALVEKLLNDVSIEDTINNATGLIDFQKCVKVSNKYGYAVYGSEKINLKVIRVFASKSLSDFAIMKVKHGNLPEKIANTPDRVFIDNNKVIGKEIPDYLDKNWYIKLANKRLDDFVCENNFTLFDYLDNVNLLR